jgi:hypothetical protein
MGKNCIDLELLRKDLMDYFGTAMEACPIAVMELSDVERASDEELICLARKNGLDLRKYEL